jgi:predicted short-subunit dehydrogenase-like oxidoreductase (DUF2520 family)
MLSRPGSRSVAIVGAGRVGRALGARLRERGWRIGAVVARSFPNARAATQAIGAGEPHAQLSDRVFASNVVLVATPDREIHNVALALARLNGSQWQRKVVLHTSGALDSRALQPLQRLGALVGSLHPLQTFSGGSIPALAGCICTLEGAAAAVRAARRICRDLGCVPVVIARRAKPAYHAGAALAAGHVLGLLEAATRLLVRAGFSRSQAVRALLPLTRQTLINFERCGPEQAWTGPLSRGDFGIVAQHLQALGPFPREYRDAYVALSRLGVQVLARRPGAKRQNLERMLAELHELPLQRR